MKTGLVLLFICMFLAGVKAQPAYWNWAKGSAGPSVTNAYQMPGSIAVDPVNPFVFVAGNYQDTAIFGNVTLSNGGALSSGVYIAKYDSSGNLLWAQTTSGTMVLGGLAADTKGNLYVTGAGAGFTLDTITVGAYSGGFFLAKFNAAGRILWLKVTPGGAAGDAVTCDHNNNPCVTGVYGDNAVTFGNYVLPANFNSPRQPFIVKFDSNGNPL